MSFWKISEEMKERYLPNLIFANTRKLQHIKHKNISLPMLYPAKAWWVCHGMAPEPRLSQPSKPLSVCHRERPLNLWFPLLRFLTNTLMFFQHTWVLYNSLQALMMWHTSHATKQPCTKYNRTPGLELYCTSWVWTQVCCVSPLD